MVRKDVLEPGKTGLSQSGTTTNNLQREVASIGSVRTPSVRELCKEKAVKYSRIKCVVFQGGARVNCALLAIFNQINRYENN